MNVYVLSLREGEFDGSTRGEDMTWGVYSSPAKAIAAMKKEYRQHVKNGNLGKKAKLWMLETYVVDSRNEPSQGWEVKLYWLDGHEEGEFPITGPKFVLPPAPPPGRCRFVYFCTMKENTPAEIERARCTKKGRHREHLTVQGLEFDHNCQEPLHNFPHIWTFYNTKDKAEKKKALAALRKLNPGDFLDENKTKAKDHEQRQ